MKHAVLNTFAIIALLPLTAQAGPITVDGREWRQVTETTNLSWTQIATVCDRWTGACSGSLGGIDFDGWVWAGVSDIGDMFRALTGYPVSDPGTVYRHGSSWAPAFFALFDPTYHSPEVVAVTGLSREANEYSAVRPYVADRSGSGSDWISTGVRATMHDPLAEVGGWFYRASGPVAMTEPGPLPLFLTGAALIWGMRSTHRRRGCRAADQRGRADVATRTR